MHPTAMQNGKAFLDTYFPSASLTQKSTVVDIGARTSTARSRSCATGRWNTLG